MENCSCPNSGTISRIQFKLFKLDTEIEHPSDITWHDSKVKGSKVKVTMVAMATPVAWQRGH